MTKLATVLTSLMSEHNISASELSRRTGVVQPVIYRMMTGETDNPKVATLTPLAHYFAITIDQLIGTEELPATNQHCISQTKITKLPILRWDQIAKWPQIDIASHTVFYATTEKISTNAFALMMQGSSMLPQFPENTLLLFDSSITPKDKDFVVIYLKEQQEVMVKQLLYDGNNLILKPLNSDFKTIYIAQEKCEFKGTLVAACIRFKHSI